MLDVLSQAELAPLEEASVVENKLSLLVLPYVPKPTKKLYSSVFRSTEEAKLRLFETKVSVTHRRRCMSSPYIYISNDGV